MDMQYKYMAAFYYGISLYTGGEIAIEDDEFKQLLFGFIVNYYATHKDIINKVFNVIYVKDKGYTYRIDYNKVAKYGNLLQTNPKKFCEMYDEIGDKNIEEITELSRLFCYYADIINDMNNNVRIRH